MKVMSLVFREVKNTVRVFVRPVTRDLEVWQLVLLAVSVGEAVDLLGQAAECGAGEVQEVVDGAFDGKALLRAVDEGGLGCARVLACTISQL